MTTTARVVVLPQDNAQLRVETIELPEPASDQVVVKQFASGICHSQLHQIHEPRQNPIILGHESTGIVTEVGDSVSHVAPGDIVMVTWVPRNIQSENKPPVAAQLQVSDGLAKSQNVFTWADHTIADQQYVVKVDPNIDKDVTAIIGCAVMTGAGAVINTAKVQKGESVAIFGVGGVGLSAVVGAKMAGANPIIAVDLDDQKLAFAKKFGATHGINAGPGRSGCSHPRPNRP
jgi:Zn-dependent alcohol dehydrogenase